MVTQMTKKIPSFQLIFRSALLGVFFLMVGCASPSGNKESDSSDPKVKAGRLLSAANLAIMDGDSPEAVRLLIDAEALAPEVPEIHFSKALAYYYMNLQEPAIASCQKTLALNPGFTNARVLLGRIYMENEQYKDAQRELEIASKDESNREQNKAYTNLGMVYYKSGQYELAQTAFENAKKRAPSDSCTANYYLGHLAARESKYDQALAFYKEATQNVCGGIFADAHYAIGLTLEKMKRWLDARKKYLDVQSLYPDTEVANKAIGRLRGLP